MGKKSKKGHESSPQQKLENSVQFSQSGRRSSGAEQPSAMSEDLRPVFAAYFNMARANLYNVLRYISAQCSLEVKQDEDSMHELAVAKFANNKRPEVRQKVFSLLMRHIPVLQQMTQAGLTQGKPEKDGKKAIPEHLTVEQQDVQQMLQNIIRVVNYHRNQFTHAKHYDTKEEQQKEIEREKALYRPLATAFKGSKREVKRIFCYTADDMNFVDQEERMKRILMKDNTGAIVKDDRGHDQYIFVEHADWYFRLYDTIANPITDMPMPEKLTTAGIMFLLCKLLHKRYATQLAQQSGLFRTREHSGNSPFKKVENEIMFNIFCAHRIRLPKGRIESTATDSALGLDMLNELQKCPYELFETLSRVDKKQFQVKRGDNGVTPAPDDDINLFRRYGDRFPQLALRYIDTMREADDENDRVLNDIVFQVALGKFRHSFYNRASLDTSEKDRVRVLQKEINGFGPLEKVEKLRKKKYNDFIRPISEDPSHLYDADTVDTAPYLTDHHTSYAITGERIGITWNTIVQNPDSGDKRNSIRLRWNDKKMERLDKDKCFLPDLPTPTENIAPRAWLSIHDLPGLIFLHMIGGNPETVIKDVYDRYVLMLKHISDGVLKPQSNKDELEKLLCSEPYKIRLRDIPKKLVDYLTGNVPQTLEKADKEFNEWVKTQLRGDTLYDSLVFLLKDIKSKNLKPRCRGIVGQEKLDKMLLCDYQLYSDEVPNEIKNYLLGKKNLNDEKDKKDFMSWVKRQIDEFEEKPVTSWILKLEKTIKKFDSDLKQVGDKQNRIGRKGYVDVRPGSLARYISKDIMLMTRPDESRKNNGKPSGLDFGVLQSAIATFKGDSLPFASTQLGKMLHNAINVSNHPFLSLIMNKEIVDTIGLYREYQREKLNFLVDLLNGKKGDYKNQWFLREAYRNHKALTPQYVQGVTGLALRYLDTLQLPDGLFTDAICKQLLVNHDTKDNKELQCALSSREKTCGVSHLINIYFTKVKGDNSQSFYREMKRHYKLLDWANFKQNQEKPVPILSTLVPPELYFTDESISTMLRKSNNQDAPIFIRINSIANRLQTKIGYKEIEFHGKTKSVPDYGEEGSASIKEKNDLYDRLIHMLRKMQRNERNIRRHRNQDMLLFLMAKKLLLSGGISFRKNASAEEGMDKFMLQDILPPASKTDESKSLLEIPIDFSLTIGLNDEKGKPILNAEGKQECRAIHQQEIKLKNYGDFFSFLYDSRIGGLLSQLPYEKPVERDDLEKELDSYDRQRLKVFAVLQAIENKIIKEHPELNDNNAGGLGFCDADGKPYRNSFSGLLSLCEQYLASEDELNELGYGIVDIRNAFSHNRYTSSDNLKVDISKMTLPQVATLILKWLSNPK